MRLEFSYVSSLDGVRIAYATMGEGPPLVAVASWGVSLEKDWGGGDRRAFWEWLAQRRRVVRFDRRGTGASQRDVGDLSLQAHLGDLNAVVEDLGLQRFDLWGWDVMEAATVSMAYAALHPERINQLVLWSPYVRGEGIASREAARSLVHLLRDNWPLAARSLAYMTYPSGPTDGQLGAFERIRESISPEMAARYYEEATAAVDVRSHLPRVQAPTLVLHPADSLFVPSSEVSAAAGQIPNARFVALAGDTACPYFNRDQYVDVVTEFMSGHGAEAPLGEVPAASAGTRAAGYPNGLTGREVEVLRLVAAGRSNRSIGEELAISTNTVDRHVSNILAKTGANNRAEAASYATLRGLLSRPAQAADDRRSRAIRDR